MVDTLSARRMQVLLTWREGVVRAGHVAPPEVILRQIGESGTWPSGGDSIVGLQPWKETIGHLLHQMKMGVLDPVPQLPVELSVPRPVVAPGSERGGGPGWGPGGGPGDIPAGSRGAHRAASGPASTAGPAGTGATGPGADSAGLRLPDDVAFGALQAWREACLRRGDERVRPLVDSVLKRVSRIRSPTVEVVARALPGDAGDLPAEVLAVLAGLGARRAGAGSPTPTPTPTPTFEPAPAPPPAPEQPVASAAEPQQPPEQPPAPTSPPDQPLDPAEFAAFSFDGQDERAPSEPHQLSFAIAGGQGVLRWEPPQDAGTFTAYRLVCRDDYEPYSPDEATLVAATTECEGVDPVPASSAVRFYQLWASTGASRRAALLSQPFLLAERALVSGVRDLVVREDEGRVVGQWSAWPETTRVQVFRVPREAAARAGSDPRYRIATATSNLGGFVDADAERGRRYLYRVAAEVVVDGTSRLSAMVTQEVLVSAVLAPVTDLAVSLDGDEEVPRFDLEWTAPPVGRVVVYRTRERPLAGAEDADLAESALEQALLPVGDRLLHPVLDEDGTRAAMRDIPWPRGWSRAYFTPVTLFEGAARVGPTRSATRTAGIRDVKVVERVDRQLLSFSWPQGAAMVKVHIGAKDQDAASAVGGPSHQIEESLHRRLGSYPFPNRLDSGGCSLHLVPVAFSEGKTVSGQPTTVAYAGLVRMQYDVSLSRTITGAPAWVDLTLLSERDLNPCPPFVLVHHPERLPLDVHDGTPLPVRRRDDETGQSTARFTPPGLGPAPSGLVWRADVKRLPGFVRLFVDIPPSHLSQVALRDPSVSRLRLAGRTGRTR